MSTQGKAPGAGGVITFRGRQEEFGLTCRDLVELARWEGPGRSVQVDPGMGAGRFAVVRCEAAPLASLGIGREAGTLRVWNCTTLADIGRFRCMRDALAALPGAAAPDGVPMVAEVIPFRPLPARAG